MLKSIVRVGSQALFKLFFAIISLKVIAYYVGPIGMGVVGQIQAVLQLLSAGTSSVSTTGVVKLVAEDKVPARTIVLNSFFLLSVLSIVLFILVAVSARSLSLSYLGGEWAGVVLLLPLAALVLGVNNLCVSYFNGRQQFKDFFWFNIFSAFFSTVVVCFCAYFFKRDGAIYSIALSPVFSGVVVLGWIVFSKKLLSVRAYFDKSVVRTLLSYSFMAIGSAVVVYGGQIFLRGYIADHGSLVTSGLWYAATRLSEIYMGICSVLFSTLLLPKYSALSAAPLRHYVWRVFLGVVFFGMAMVGAVWCFGDYAIRLVYGEEFSGAGIIIRLYVFGDALKCLSWVFLYVLIARQKVRSYIFYEIVSAAMYLLFIAYFYTVWGIESAAYGYALQGLVSVTLLIIWFLLTRNSIDFIKQGPADD